MKLGPIGAPDIYVLRSGTLYGIEVKDDKNPQSRQQIIFQSEFERAGGTYLLARCLDDVIEVLS